MQRCKWEMPGVALAEITYGKVITCGLRFYEPGVGRFGQRDPAREGVNWYVYVANQPALLTDPSGEVPTYVLAACGYAAFCGVAGAVYGSASIAVVPKHVNRDKLAHCIAACVIRRCGTIVLSWLFGWVKELYDGFKGEGVDKGDLAANREEEKCAKDVRKVVDCDECCRKKYPVPTPGMGRGPIF